MVNIFASQLLPKDLPIGHSHQLCEFVATKNYHALSLALSLLLDKLRTRKLTTMKLFLAVIALFFAVAFAVDLTPLKAAVCPPTFSIH